mgnify:CR=1 FL=1
MIMISNKDFYEEQLNYYKQEEKSLEKEFSLISTLRIFSFLIGLALLLIGIFDEYFVLGVAGAALLFLFLYLVKRHSNVVIKQEKAESKKITAGRYIDRFKDEWRKFDDNGSEFLLDEDTVPRDIDLLGPASLYQMISVCHTLKGRKLLAEKLRLENVKVSENKKRSEAVAELMEKKKFAIEYEAAGIRLANKKHKQDIEKFIAYCDDEKTGIIPFWMELLRFALPIVEISLIVLWACRIVGCGFPLVGLFALLVIAGMTSSVSDAAIVPFYAMGTAVDNYDDMLLLIESEKFQSELLCKMKEYVSGDSGSVNAFKSLRKISQAYNISYNPFLHLIFTGLLMWDYQLAHFTSRWKRKYGKNIGRTFDVISEFEELLSLSVLGNVRKTTWANVDENTDEARLSGENMYHPLINPDEVVENGIELSGGITIITGSNMSGKTTFLRTVAVNLALSYLGAPVCADSFFASYMKLFTSMRVMDDVAHGISTFYAEILRIKAMAEYKEKKLPMICLIDEIFKGTNSADRIVGATEAITRLAGKECITVVSTHDFELCNIEDKNGHKAYNYHFEEYYDNDELKFDYKIRNGRCTTTNALAILRMAGFDVKK